MKPDIDINAPLFKLAETLLQKELKKAFKAEKTIENAIIPIYNLPKSKAHQKKKTKLEQIASGVLLRIKDEYFVLTADHVFENISQYAIAISTGSGKKIEQFRGERYGSKIYDASAYHIQVDIPNSLKKIAISLDHIDFSIDDEEKPIYLISGFRVRDSNIEGNVIDSKRKSLPTTEMGDDDYDKFNYVKKSHLLLAYEDQILINGHWKVSPKPKGMSGGGIIKVEGTGTSIFSNKKTAPEQKLTAITIEHHRGKHKNPGILVGIRLIVHISLLNQFMPNLLSDFFKNIESK